MPTIRLLDMGPLDGLEVEVTSLPQTAEHFGRQYVRVGYCPERQDASGKLMYRPAVIYAWERIHAWMTK